MMELRTYTLADAAALQCYVDSFWPRHMRSLSKFGITVHGVWTDTAGGHRVIALIGYPANDDPQRLAENYRDSAEFVDDHADFDVSLIISTETQTLRPIASSPLQ